METIFDQMDKERVEAVDIHKQLVKSDKGKTYLDILPADLVRLKRSIIKTDIVEGIKRATQTLNESSLFDGRKFTEVEVTRFMFAQEEGKHHVAWLFIPPKSTTELYFRDKNFSKLPDVEKRKYSEPYEKIEHDLQWLRQSWDAWISRQNIKAGKMAHDYSVEKDGRPRTGRGNLCSVYTPVKGWKKNEKGTIKLFNPRNKKNVLLTIDKYVREDDVYICTDEQGKKFYLTSFESVEEAWSCLFSINKEIFSGWWNKTLIWK